MVTRGQRAGSASWVGLWKKTGTYDRDKQHEEQDRVTQLKFHTNLLVDLFFLSL
jgi:hypothetical protein